MPAVVHVPSPLRLLTRGKARVAVEGRSVEACIASLERDYPGFQERLVDESGEVKPFISVFLNGENVERLQGLRTPVEDGDEITIVPAVAGGGDCASAQQEWAALTERPSLTLPPSSASGYDGQREHHLEKRTG